MSLTDYSTPMTTLNLNDNSKFAFLVYITNLPAFDTDLSALDMCGLN